MKTCVLYFTIIQNGLHVYVTLNSFRFKKFKTCIFDSDHFYNIKYIIYQKWYIEYTQYQIRSYCTLSVSLRATWKWLNENSLFSFIWVERIGFVSNWHDYYNWIKYNTSQEKIIVLIIQYLIFETRQWQN